MLLASRFAYQRSLKVVIRAQKLDSKGQAHAASIIILSLAELSRDFPLNVI